MVFAARRCGICHRLVEQSSIPFCPDHLLQYEARQREGVSTAHLSFRWGDSLANWQERPAELADEKVARRFRFLSLWNDWLLFMHGFSDRLPDWLVVNVRTHEVRRFVEVSEDDVRDDLLGRRPAPHQEALPQRWGRPEPRMVADQGSEHQFSAGVSDAPMPIFGIADQRFGLRLTSVTRSSSAHGLQLVGLTFASPRHVQPVLGCSITSIDPLYLNRLVPLRELAVAEDIGVNLEASSEASIDEADDTTITIAGSPFIGHIHHIAGSPPRWEGKLTGDGVIINTNGYGLQRIEALNLLEHLVDIRGQRALLAQYQLDLDEWLSSV